MKIGHYRGLPPPGAEVALNAMLIDPMAEPPYRWRVPYVIVCGTQTSRLMDLAVNPMELLKRGSAYRINSVYYITKCVLPALDRMLALCGVSVKDWFASMKKRKLSVRHIVYETNNGTSSSSSHMQHPAVGVGGATIIGARQHMLRQQSMDQYALRGSCECCSRDSATAVCPSCSHDPATSYLSLQSTLTKMQKIDHKHASHCSNCARMPQPAVLFVKDQVVGPQCCACLDCRMLYERCKIVLKIENNMHALDALTTDVRLNW